MNIRKRHMMLLAGMLSILVGALLASITVGRLFFDSPAYFYYYSTHPFMDLGIGLCAVGGLLVLGYIFLKLRDILKARKAPRPPQAPVQQ